VSGSTYESYVASLTYNVCQPSETAFVFDIGHRGDIDTRRAEKHNKPPDAKGFDFGTDSVEQCQEGKLDTPQSGIEKYLKWCIKAHECVVPRQEIKGERFCAGADGIQLIKDLPFDLPDNCSCKYYYPCQDN
jgi:hypothetical protein